MQPDDLIYLLDYSGPPGFVDALAALRPKRVIVLDHHKTAAADLARPEIQKLEGVEILFDMHRSGAMISHDYFQPLVRRLLGWVGWRGFQSEGAAHTSMCSGLPSGAPLPCFPPTPPSVRRRASTPS